jgi:hypothetical protein
VQRVVVARQPGEGDDVGFRDGAGGRDEAVADLEVIEMKACAFELLQE